MTQLDLFDWSYTQSLLHDHGGRCSYCLESNNWLTVDQFTNDDHLQETIVECQTVRIHEDGSFDTRCRNVVELVEGMRR